MTMTQAQFEKGLQDRMENDLEYGGISTNDVRELLDAIGAEIAASLKKEERVTVRGIGIFSTKKKPATRARKGINPFTKEEQMFKAKPASTQVKVRPAKALKAPFEKKK